MAEKQPNILFLLPDQWRPDFLGFRKIVPVRTPNIDRLAASGMFFDRATTPSPLCAPARACLASGLAYRRNPVRNNGQDYPIDRPNIYRLMRDAGYQVGSVGKLDLHKATFDWGLDGRRCMDEWGFTHGFDNEGKLDAMQSYLKNGRKPRGPYMNFLANHPVKPAGREGTLADLHADDFKTRNQWLGVEPTELPEDAYCDNWIGRNGIDVLRSYAHDAPWFLAVNFTGPHNPQDITRSMLELYETARFAPAKYNTTVETELMNRIRCNYAAMCENIDMWVGRFLSVLEERGEIDNTIIIFSSDHGEMLGDHDQWGKSIWRQSSAGIPMIISGRAGRQGTVPHGVCHDLVQLHDLAPTLVELAGSEDLPGLDPGLDAQSLLPLLKMPSKHGEFRRQYAFTGLNSWDSIRDSRWKLVFEDGKATALYDLENDPDETLNLAGKTEDSLASQAIRELQEQKYF